MARSQVVRVWEVLFDGDADGPSGPAGDGTFVARFSSQGEADTFAAANTCYGRPCRVPVAPSNVPRRIAQRWGMA